MFKAIRRWFARPSNPAGHVYYVRLKTPQGVYYKIGYTSKSSMHDRFAFGGHGDEELIDREFFFTFHPKAWDIEQKLLDHFDKQRAFGRYSNRSHLPLPGRGQSELFPLDVLGLDEALYRASNITAAEVQGPSAHEVQTNGCLFVLIGIALTPFTFGLSLFFIIGGGIDFFSGGKSAGRPVNLRTSKKRPQHPPEIRALVESLAGRQRV